MWGSIGDFLCKHSDVGVYLGATYAAGMQVLEVYKKYEAQQAQDRSMKGFFLNILPHVALFVFVGVFGIASSVNDQRRAKKRRKELDTLCEFAHQTLKLDSKARISIFERDGSKLAVAGRFARFESRKKSSVKFTSGKGCTGIAYKTGSIAAFQDLPDFSTHPEDYYAACTKMNMTKSDVNSLHWKNRSVVGIPIKYYKREGTAAVMVLDSMAPQAFTNEAISEAARSADSDELRLYFGGGE